MGALCGKKSKKAYDIPIGNPAQLVSNVSQQIGNAAQQKPKLQVQIPNLDKSPESQQKKPEKKPEKNPNPNQNQSPEKKKENPKKSQNKPDQIELRMSPNKSPSNPKPPQVIKETEGLTPNLDDPNSLTKKGNNSASRQLEVLPLLEPERRTWFETGEFIGEAILGEDEFIWPEQPVLEEEPKLPEIKNGERLPIIGFKKQILEASYQEKEANYYEFDLFDVLQTFEPEEEEESAKGRSDINELNSSGIQYKEEEYGNIVVKPKSSEDPKKEYVMELNNEIIEEKKDESDIPSYHPDERPSEKQEIFQIDKAGFSEDEKIDDDNSGLNIGDNYKNKEEEEEEANQYVQEKKEMLTNDALNFLAEENPEEQNMEEFNEPVAFKEEKIDLDNINIEEQFFLNKVEIEDFEDEKEEPQDNQDNENQDENSQEKENEEKEANNQQNENEFSFDEVTPQKTKDRLSVRPNSASLKKKLNWWSAKKD